VLMSRAHARPKVSAGIPNSGPKIKPTNQNRSASASPSSPPFQEKKGGLVSDGDNSTTTSIPEKGSKVMLLEENFQDPFLCTLFRWRSADARIRVSSNSRKQPWRGSSMSLPPVCISLCCPSRHQRWKWANIESAHFERNAGLLHNLVRILAVLRHTFPSH
jgi:hypothetical protein